MELDERIENLVESLGYSFSFCPDSGLLELERYTPAGEDWTINLGIDGTPGAFGHAVSFYYEDFDVDEEAEIWIGTRGKRGVPSSIRTLIEDAEWKESQLEKLSRAASALMKRSFASS